MASQRRWRYLFPMLGGPLAAALLTACGGGSGDGAALNTADASTASLVKEPGAPVLTGDIARDGYSWINYRRAQLGLSVLARNSQIDAAALAHSNYQRLNNSVTHDETAGLPGYSGADLGQRLASAGYQLVKPYAYGEIISATANSSGFYQAEELITAIYHRFVMFEPVFKEVGTGAATNASGYTYFTSDLAANNGYSSGLGKGRLVTYPFSNQTKVATDFFSDNETPDPVPNQNEVGYPISVHADISSVLTVQSFSVSPRGGAALAVRLLSAATDKEIQNPCVAAIIPLAVLAAGTTYDVTFKGLVDGVAVTRSWSFTTQ